MVWILTRPNGFGDYWPIGDFQGWSESRYQLFAGKPEAYRSRFDHNDRKYAKWVSDKFTSEVGTRVGNDPVLTPLDREEVPRLFTTEKNYTSLASLIRVNNGMLAVDDDLKSIIERLEPGLHQFYPIGIVMPKGQIYPKAYSLLVVGQFLNSFSPEQSAEGSWRTEVDYNDAVWPRTNTKDCYAALAFERRIMGDAHLWREQRFIHMEPFISERLQSEIINAGLRVPKRWKAREV